MSRAVVDADRMASAVEERRRWVSDPVLPWSGGYPAVGMTDESYRLWRGKV